MPAASPERDRQQLQTLHAAGRQEEMDLPGWHVQRLSGRGAGRYPLRMAAKWRITFGWENGNAIALDFEDYH
ncbi:type II toxin-antitoxin system RelE/ParE family toxin [Lichenicola sp.]|uniref:type II toxin-antitoxin system RelE/ParE family toxin n=1 Tax=Lichenicola sp. TaxID=2804529 RepID=UPI003B0048A8